MKILSAVQIRQADAHTIAEEGIPSWALMERAAQAFAAWFDQRFCRQNDRRVLVCCGPGNNGGDGLAIARLLSEKDYEVRVWTVAPEGACSPDFQLNRGRLPASVPVSAIAAETGLPPLPDGGFMVMSALVRRINPVEPLRERKFN